MLPLVLCEIIAEYAIEYDKILLDWIDINKLDWRILSLADKKKDIKGIDDISERIYMELDNIIGNLKELGINEIDYVLIENQPSNLNGIMKTIQYIIYCYFSLLKYWDKIIDNVVPDGTVTEKPGSTVKGVG